MMAEQVRVIITTVMSRRGRRERSRCQDDCHCRVWVEWIATATVSVREIIGQERQQCQHAMRLVGPVRGSAVSTGRAVVGRWEDGGSSEVVDSGWKGGRWPRGRGVRMRAVRVGW